MPPISDESVAILVADTEILTIRVRAGIVLGVNGFRPTPRAFELRPWSNRGSPVGNGSGNGGRKINSKRLIKTARAIERRARFKSCGSGGMSSRSGGELRINSESEKGPKQAKQGKKFN